MSRDPFAGAVSACRRGLGTARDAVRQELVALQLRAHLPRVVDGGLRALDVGCGQGTQAMRLARLGHRVIGVDLSEELLGEARRAAAAEPAAVHARLAFQPGDLLDLGPELVGRFDLVCCHGVVPYLPSLQEAIRALVAAARPGGLVSMLTRNRASLAMRAGLSGDWPAALERFDARYFTNRLGVRGVRADEPEQVRDALAVAGARVLAWYGVRLFSDHWPADEAPADLAGLLAAERVAGERDPYRSLAALTHTVAQVADP